jgi:hypothetical protein
MLAGKLQTGRAAGAEKIGMALVGSYDFRIISQVLGGQSISA